jgi:hypothetical protein
MVLRVRLSEQRGDRQNESEIRKDMPKHMHKAHKAWHAMKTVDKHTMPFGTTIHMLNSAIMNLSKVQTVYDYDDQVCNAQGGKGG